MDTLSTNKGEDGILKYLGRHGASIDEFVKVQFIRDAEAIGLLKEKIDFYREQSRHMDGNVNAEELLNLERRETDAIDSFKKKYASNEELRRFLTENASKSNIFRSEYLETSEGVNEIEFPLYLYVDNGLFVQQIVQEWDFYVPYAFVIDNARGNNGFVTNITRRQGVFIEHFISLFYPNEGQQNREYVGVKVRVGAKSEAFWGRPGRFEGSIKIYRKKHINCS